MQQKTVKKLILFLVLLFGIIGFFLFNLQRYFSLEYLQLKRHIFIVFYHENIFTTLIMFSLIYISIIALSLPGAAIMTLLAGALFGFITGTAIASTSSTIGATLAFLISRYLFKDFIQSKYSSYLTIVNAGIEKDGIFYLFALRLIPIFPFFLINLVMSVTPIKARVFFLVSWIAMLPGTMAYIFAGAEIGQLTSLEGLLSPKVILAFVLLGTFPLLAKKTMDWVNRWKKHDKI